MTSKKALIMKLTTIEKFLLLAQHPDKGRFVISDIQLNHSILGLLFIKMFEDDGIFLDNNRIVINENYEPVDPILSDMVMNIRKSRRKRRLRTWIMKLSGKAPKYKRTILEQMQKKGLLRIEVKKIIVFITYNKVYLEDQEIRDGLIKILRNAVLEEKELTPEMLVLLAMSEACKMHRVYVSTRAELRTFRASLKKIIKDNPVANDVEQSIRQVQAAIVAIVATSAAAAAASSSR
ncbi:MAG: GPP34 family phosphoprotein [Bacteroidetes bacterium]|nr:MAG: GPP34 family phosphoprotein [Bacteroidota bacterium]